MSVSPADKIGRYRAWLNRENVDRPLAGLVWEPDIPPLPVFLDQVRLGQEVRPEAIDPELFLPQVEAWYRQDLELAGDAVQPFSPAFGIPWVEAIAGCRVVAHPGSLWAESVLDDYRHRPAIRFDPANPWLRKLIEFTRALVTLADGRFPVALPQMRGPLDTLAALRTPAQMSVDFVECPDEVITILDELTDLWIGVAEAILEVIPPFHGGYSSRMKLWAPGKTITPQNDISTLLSPKMYRDMVLPLDERIVSRFPYHCFHVHSSEHHQIDNWLRLDRLTAIQFTLEHTLGGPPLEVTLPVARRILAQKPLLLTALDIETAEICMAELPAAGLFVAVGLNDYQIPETHKRWLAARTS